ncbi:hypothetical protein SAMN05421821_105137 [Mucilaginibacter lappiensis]|uniref:Bacteriophage lambda head decoration protein D n=1 Tax=Mucilaginibacter lappiensis TaxID=354630 RepID=A0ABR6PIX2_9SPHI|nr:hypothetical protein [Mucilaginibacter lappiensis]MBB6109719.1 hypothetical protein [Mucilaginibacter lappiensis]SIR13040.1 hypothetical protein SAMN05421821_105137 [Mucilaginibacter lappiensis]
MAEVNLTNDSEQIITGNDNIAIVDVFATVRGGRSLNVSGFTPEVIYAGHPIIKETATGDYKPLPATADSVAGVATLGTVVPGAAYTNGTYTNVPLSGGSGKGVLATVVVAGTVVTTVTKTKGGSGYKVGDSLSVPAEYAGGTGNGASVPVASVESNVGVYGALPVGHTYQGVLIASILTKKAFAGIMTQGTINPVACPNDFATIAAAFKAAVPLIDQRAD